jgi:hypothetical protein
MNKFKENEVVLYQNGDIFELGVVKKVINRHSHYDYFVWYHIGNTTACTNERLLKKIINNYAFQIIRKDVENNVATQKARRLANNIIENVIEPKLLRPLQNEEYFDIEDHLTELIETFEE